MLVEICTNSYQSFINAQQSGADRIELCTELAVGGLTPSYGLIQKVMTQKKLLVNVLIRPRSGDFTYSNSDFEVMKSNINLCKDLGCNGIVSGVLHTDFTIDIARTRELIELANPMEFTFHRAFDWTPNPLQSLEQLKLLKVQRILTSGQETTAEKGFDLLQKLQEKAENNLIILPGGGINKNNILLFKKAGFKEVHFSATSLEKTIEKPKISMNSPRFFEETKVAISTVDNITTMIHLVK